MSLDKCRANIAIIEPSAIICEGLSNIILQERRVRYSLYHYDCLGEFLKESPNGSNNIVVVNPSLIQNNLKSFHSFNHTNKSIIWIGILYSFFEKEILDLFDGFIQITDTPGIIIDTIHKLITSKCNDKHFPTKEQLTPRETEVLKFIAQGLSNKEVADHLNISIHTVVSHRKNIVQKTGIKSQAGLTIYAISNKIIDIKDYRK